MANTTPTTNSLENYFLPFTANKDFKKDPRLLDREGKVCTIGTIKAIR